MTTTCALSRKKTKTRWSPSKRSRKCSGTSRRADSVRQISAQSFARRRAQWTHHPPVIVLVTRATLWRLQIAKAVPFVELERRLHLRDRFQVAPHVQELPCRS